MRGQVVFEETLETRLVGSILVTKSLGVMGAFVECHEQLDGKVKGVMFRLGGLICSFFPGRQRKTIIIYRCRRGRVYRLVKRAAKFN